MSGIKLSSAFAATMRIYAPRIATARSAAHLCTTIVPEDTLFRLMEIVSLRLIRLAVLPYPPMHAIVRIAAGYLRSTTLNFFSDWQSESPPIELPEPPEDPPDFDIFG